MIELIIDVGHSDLCFMVQWFGLIMLHWSPVMFASLFFMHANNFSFIGKAQFRWATLSCDKILFLA